MNFHALNFFDKLDKKNLLISTLIAIIEQNVKNIEIID